MKRRSPVAVLLLPFITFGIYSFYWQIKTKLELNTTGRNIPTAWLYIVPIVNIWWLWKYSEGVEEYTQEKMSTVLAFVVLFLLGFIGQAIIQSTFNQTARASSTDVPLTPPVNPAAPVAAATPAITSDNENTAPPTPPGVQ